MKTLLSFITTIVMVLPSFAQVSTTPDWANKKGAFGIGLNTTLGGQKYETPEFDQIDRLCYSAIGLHIQYNPVPFVNVAANVGISNEKSMSEDDFAESGYEFKGTNLDFKILFPLFGGNGFLTPGCQSSIIASPYIGVNLISGTDMWYYDPDGGFGDYDETASFNKNIINVGTRIEYFLPEIANLHSSVQLNINIFGSSKTNYEREFRDLDNEGIYFLNTGQTFGAFGFTVWFN